MNARTHCLGSLYSINKIMFSKIICISTDFQEPYAVVVLLEKDLVVIDLAQIGWVKAWRDAQRLFPSLPHVDVLSPALCADIPSLRIPIRCPSTSLRWPAVNISWTVQLKSSLHFTLWAPDRRGRASVRRWCSGMLFKGFFGLWRSWSLYVFVQEWPVSGGNWGQGTSSYSEIIITGYVIWFHPHSLLEREEL